MKCHPVVSFHGLTGTARADNITWLVLAVAVKRQPPPPCGKTNDCMCNRSEINVDLGFVVFCIFFFFPQTVILISENHKFIHLPFSLEVKCKFQNRTGFNVCNMSKSCRTETYWSYVCKKKKKPPLPCDTTFDYSHGSVFRNLHISINLLNLTNNSKMWLSSRY